MPEIKHIHHIAILVDNLDTSLTFWQDILGLKPSRVSDMPQESARIAIFPLGGSEIELVQPTTADSGLSRYLEKRGPGMHHLCLEVTDLYILLEQLKANGGKLTTSRKLEKVVSCTHSSTRKVPMGYWWNYINCLNKTAPDKYRVILQYLSPMAC